MNDPSIPEPPATDGPRPPAVLMIGFPGWLSGPCPPSDPAPGLTVAEVAEQHPTWAIDPDDHGNGVSAQRGEVRLWAYSTAEMAALLGLADGMMP